MTTETLALLISIGLASATLSLMYALLSLAAHEDVDDDGNRCTD